MSETKTTGNEGPSKWNAGQSTELLPPRFFGRRRAIRVLGIWGFIVVALVAATCGMIVPVWLRGQRIRSNNSRLITEANPLSELRKKTQRMEALNKQQTKWNSWVESAKPDDSLLQTLAAIAHATQPAETEIDIETLEIKLPLEYPESYQPTPPRWAEPRLSINARVKEGKTTLSWIKRLRSSNRIEDIGSQPAARGTIQINATPVATRWVP